MKAIKRIGLITTVLFTISNFSCNDEFLDITPKNSLTSNSVFSTEAGADLFLNDIYDGLPDPEIQEGINYGNIDFLSPYTLVRHKFSVFYRRSEDRAITANSFRGPTGLYNHGYPEVPFQYPDVMIRIRRCNLFLESIEEYKEHYSEEWYTKRKAEARVLRVYFYENIWKAFGGVPIIRKVLKQREMGDDIFVPSASIREVYEFMVSELEAVYMDLPNILGDGHVTRGAALALLAWINLYMGDITIDPRPKAIGDPDPDFARSCYLQSVEACRKIMELGIYSLFPNYNDQFLQENNNNSESIWAIQHLEITKPTIRTARHGPYWSKNNGVHASTINPTQEMVDLYRMSDGLGIDESPLYDPRHPYDNREQRFYESIIADSTIFGGKLFTLDGIGEDESLIKPNKGQVSTGYYRRKGINPNLEQGVDLNQDAANLPIFRYGEILLIYAEAKIKAGEPDASAEDAINQVRLRGNIPTIQDSYGISLASMPFQDQKDLVWNERRVELAWEYKDYWDIIRTRRAEILLNQPCRGVRKGDNSEGYQYVTVRNNVWPNDKYYLFPIYFKWLERNPAWMDPDNQVDGRTNGQNPGY